MYRKLKRIYNDVKSIFQRNRIDKSKNQAAEKNPEHLNAITVFSNRLEDRNISSIEEKQNV